MSSGPPASMNFMLMGQKHLLTVCNLCRIVEKRRITKGWSEIMCQLKTTTKTNQEGMVFKQKNSPLLTWGKILQSVIMKGWLAISIFSSTQ